MNEEIPTGSYCYGYVPAADSGFRDMAELEAYLGTLPIDQQVSEFERTHKVVFCPHWRSIGHGRVCCTLLKLVAPGIGEHSQRLAAAYYRKHPEVEERETGILLGDAVKECNINKDGIDFSFPSDPRNKTTHPSA